MAGLRTDEAALASHRPAHGFASDLWRLYVDDAGRDVAMALVNPTADDRGFEIAYLGVVSESRGKGLGLRVLVDVLHRCEPLGRDVIVLAVDASNEPARCLYRQAGFAFVQQRDAWVRRLTHPSTTPAVDHPMPSA
jgi:ribosomal protein S18 acetylase RimI-like enzyme